MAARRPRRRPKRLTAAAVAARALSGAGRSTAAPVAARPDRPDFRRLAVVAYEYPADLYEHDFGVTPAAVIAADDALRADCARRYPDNPDRAAAAYHRWRYALLAAAVDAAAREDDAAERARWAVFVAGQRAGARGADGVCHIGR